MKFCKASGPNTVDVSIHIRAIVHVFPLWEALCDAIGCNRYESKYVKGACEKGRMLLQLCNHIVIISVAVNTVAVNLEQHV